MAAKESTDDQELLQLLQKKRPCPEAPSKLSRIIALVREFVGLEFRLNRIIGPFHETGSITGLCMSSSGELYFCDTTNIYRADIYGRAKKEIISKDVLAIFGMFDKDRDGYLRQDEFRLVCELIDPEIDDDLAQQMFTQFDVDESERIDTLEFSHAIEYWKTTDPNVMQKLAMVSPNLILEGDDQQTSPRESRDGAEEYGQPEVAPWENQNLSTQDIPWENFLGNLKNTGFFNDCGSEGSDLYAVRLQRARALYEQKQKGQASQQQEMLAPVKEAAPDQERLAPGWHKMFDQGSGRYYYQNNISKVTQWTPPPMEDSPVGQQTGIEMQPVQQRQQFESRQVATALVAPMPTPVMMNAPTPADGRGIYDMPPQSEVDKRESVWSSAMNINMDQQIQDFPDVSKATSLGEGTFPKLGHKRTPTSRMGPRIFRPKLEKITGLNKTGFRDGALDKAAFNRLEDLIIDETMYPAVDAQGRPTSKKSRFHGNIFAADRQNSCIRNIDYLRTRKVSTAAWSMKPKCLCIYDGNLYGVSDGHLKSYIYCKQADMYFDYGCHDDLEGVCVDDINRRFYLAQKVKAKRVTGSKKVARRRKIVSMEAVGLKPRRFRMEPPNLQDEFILEYSGGEEVLDVKTHPSGMLLVCTTAGIYGARIAREYSQTIYPSEEKTDEYVHKAGNSAQMGPTEPYDILRRKWTCEIVSPIVTESIAVSTTGEILMAVGNKVLEYKIDGELASG